MKKAVNLTAFFIQYHKNSVGKNCTVFSVANCGV